MSGRVYTEEQTRRWLGWLARGMQSQQLSMFLVEELQPTWLPEKERGWYFAKCRFLVLGGFLSLHAVLCYLTYRVMWPFDDASLSFLPRHPNYIESLTIFAIALTLAFFIPGGNALLMWKNLEARRKDPSTYIRAAASVGMSTEGFGDFGRGFVWYFIGPIFLALMPGALSVDLKPKKVELSTSPNLAVRLSLWNAIKILTGGAIVIGMMLVAELILLFRGRGLNGFTLAFFCELIFLVYLYAAASEGGLEVLTHFVLRDHLYRRGRIPRRYVDFLDYAANELGFLQKAGGSYLFIHRYLLEYFAESALPGEERNLLPARGSYASGSSVTG